MAERIANIRIQCSCGQVMELACVYDEPAKDKIANRHPAISAAAPGIFCQHQKP